jgi:hypothetical protein
MISIAQTTAKLWIVALALLAFVAPVSAASVVFLANPPAGNDNNPCSFASPCQTLGGSLGKLDSNGQVTCAQGTAFGSAGFPVQSVIIDCPGLFVPNQTAFEGFLGEFIADGIVIKIRHLTVNGQFAGTGAGGVLITGGSGGTLVLEDCVFENFSGTAIQIAANGPYTLILKNTRISNNGAGVVIKPASGGSVTATFDGVTIDGNTGGGLKTDTTNGPVRVDISNSTISNNSGNGLNAVSGAGGANMLNLKNDVIAGNGTAGVQANGPNAAALIDMTLLDSNASGALTTINGGRLLTYGNNHIVGSAGSGFTGTAPLN